MKIREELVGGGLDELFAEFDSQYLQTPAGQSHIRSYAQSREQARINWEKVLQHDSAGDDVTDLVLDGLLPHYASSGNVDRGVWTHVAPAITKDLKKWFENTGWAKPEDWPQIARTVLLFLKRAISDPEDLDAACAEFAASPYSKGIQTAFLSPIVNALRPENYLIQNSKTFQTLRFLTGHRYKPGILHYPEANRVLKEFASAQQGILHRLAGANALPCDALDQFCHWLVAEKGVTRKRQPSRHVPEALDRSSAESAEHVISAIYPNEDIKRRICQFFLETVEEANKFGSARWTITLRRRRVRLSLGRLLALEMRPGGVRLGLVLEQADDALKRFLENNERRSQWFSTTPPSGLYVLSASDYLSYQDAITPLFKHYLQVAAGTARKSSVTSSYSPGVLAYLEQFSSRQLPRPAHDNQQPGELTKMTPAVTVKGERALFKKSEYFLSGLLNYIDNGDIALPDIQRPFVWSTSKVRDLLDSMYRGFPVGYLLLWVNTTEENTRTISGETATRIVPHLLIVDGQQRLTSLYAVFRNRAVLDKNFRKQKLEIAFRPRDGHFEVSDAAIRLDPEYIPNVANLWNAGRSSFSIISDFLKKLESRRAITDEDREAISHNLDRLMDLEKYPFTALEISENVDEEAVSDIFVRINSQGVNLRQADFILTLLSVFWDEGRLELESFCRDARRMPHQGSPPSPFNYLIEPNPSQLLRAGIAVAFHRARLRSVYQVLRGKDPDTGQVETERRATEFEKLKLAQTHVLNLDNWHRFISSITSAGYRSSQFVSSDTGLVFNYALYILGKRQCGVPDRDLQRLISRWYVMTALTGRYSGSSETEMEADLTKFRDCKSAQDFADVIETTIANTLSNDFWNITLPTDLESSSTRTQAWSAYVAAQNKLGSPVLFSDKRMWEATDPAVGGNRKPLEAHHLFPRAWLVRNGFAEQRQINQIANLAHLEWPENVRIGASPPEEYVPEIRPAFSDAAWERMCKAHALPSNWESLDYGEFLTKRRALMAAVIREGFERIRADRRDPDLHEDYWTGTPTEQQVWRQIETLELALRELVNAKYEKRWGAGIEDKLRSVLGSDSWQTIQRNREKYQKQYGPAKDGPKEIFQFCYLGQLVQLMLANQAWEMFKDVFRDKRELQDMIGAIQPVRNDAAHFRSVPERELTRCKLVVEDFLEKIRKISRSEKGPNEYSRPLR